MQLLYSLVLPIVTREFITSMNAGADANETVDLANFGFLYGTFPTAPGVFVYATHFNVEVDLVMLQCLWPLTFFSF